MKREQWEAESVVESNAGSLASSPVRGLPGAPPQLLTEYPVLQRAWQDTQQILAQAVALLKRVLPAGVVRTVAVSGSLGRMEKTAKSDLDLIVIVPDRVSTGDEVVQVSRAKRGDSLQDLPKRGRAGFP